MIHPKLPTNIYPVVKRKKEVDGVGGKTTDEEHEAGLGKMATNDTAESLFAGLTHQLDNFGTILGIHAAGISQARINGDFKRKNVNGNKIDGMYHILPTKMKQSLLTMAINEASTVRRHETIAIEKQQQHKQHKQELLKRIKLLKAETLSLNDPRVPVLISEYRNAYLTR